MEERWYAIWDIVFGSRARPTSIYAEDIRAESLTVVRELVDISGPQVIETIMRRRYPVVATTGDAAGLFRQVLNAFDSADVSSSLV